MKRFLVLLLMIAVALGLSSQSKKPADKIKSGETLKILHVMSFNSPWVWTDKQLAGFQEPFKNIKVEYKIIQMDAKKKTPAEQEKIANEAIDVINTWKPDLVYTSDDAAQKYIVTKFINSNIPFVFSGVNKKPEFYGYNGSKNIIGVLEQEHFVPTVKFMQKMLPNIKKLAVFTDDDDANWSDIYDRIKEKTTKELAGMTLVDIYKFKTYSDYKNKVLELNKSKAVDAVIFVGWFKFKDDKGNNVDQTEVAKWNAENSKIPECTFWEDRIIKGNLCSVTVDGYEQGLAAGKLAYNILALGKAPSSFTFEPTFKGKPVISLARAKKLGLKIPSDILLSTMVVEKFEWDK